MKRWALGFFLFSIIGIGCAAVEEGKQYTLVEPAVLVTTPNNEVEVIEFFSYGCPHCATLAPYFSEWAAKKPDYVIVKKVPVEFNPAWENYAKLYYTAESLKIADKMDKVIFDAVQRGVDLSNEAVAADLFAQRGVDPDVFKKTYHSFSVNTSLNQGRFLAQQYKVMQVPQVIVDGRYKTDMGMTGGPQGIGPTLDVLVEKAKALRQTTTK